MNKSARNITFLPLGKPGPARTFEPGDTAEIPVVKVPVRCPHCQVEQLYEFPEPVVILALTRWNNMNLYVPCHDGHWSATRGELESIREYLGEAWLKSRVKSVVTSHPRLRVLV